MDTYKELLAHLDSEESNKKQFLIDHLLEVSKQQMVEQLD